MTEPINVDRIAEVNIRRYSGDDARSETDDVAIEEPLEIRVNGQSLVVTMRTPGHDRFLAAGFLLGEGIIRRSSDLLAIDSAPDRDGFPQPNVLDVRLDSSIVALDSLVGRNFYMTSSCGLCGKASVDAVRVRAPAVAIGRAVAPSVIRGLEAKLRGAQAVFARTGGLHAAGLFDFDGERIALHEDVGRHNAVDKVFGEMLLAGRIPTGDAILHVSGRASFELLQKAVVAGVTIFVAVGAPSSLAVEMAQTSNVTLIGMVRNGGFVVYSVPERIR